VNYYYFFVVSVPIFAQAAARRAGSSGNAAASAMKKLSGYLLALAAIGVLMLRLVDLDLASFILDEPQFLDAARAQLSTGQWRSASPLVETLGLHYGPTVFWFYGLVQSVFGDAARTNITAMCLMLTVAHLALGLEPGAVVPRRTYAVWGCAPLDRLLPVSVLLVSAGVGSDDQCLRVVIGLRPLSIRAADMALVGVSRLDLGAKPDGPVALPHLVRDHHRAFLLGKRVTIRRANECSPVEPGMI